MALYFISSTCGADKQSGTIKIETPISTHEEYNDLIKNYTERFKLDFKIPKSTPVFISSFNRLD